uniref:Uncharacterized protein n=1 Tax=Brassica oleracea var. oleracea TaxID=109376 RepID=A0A0D2ZQ76_BRAOL
GFPRNPNFAGYLKTLNVSIEACFRISYLVFDIMPQDVRDQCAGFRARPRFKVRDRFSAYTACMA